MINRKSLQWLAALLVFMTFLGALLVLDLTQQGLAWRIFWSLTGEERPSAQILGMVEWAGNFTRPQPITDPMVPIQHVEMNPYGINTFLEQEVEPDKRERSLQMISEAGFTWIRQQFPWYDLEIHERGDFEDRRNVEAVGVISAWDKYDQIVDLAEQYGVRIHARLDAPPAWSHANPDIGAFAPPDDLQDFVNYAVAVAERYKGRIHYYQVWNEPNIYPEWGEQAVNPELYTELLCRTYQALKAVDPEIVVVTGALAPTVALSGRDLNDYVFLQRMYDAGVNDCFDILAAQGYGLNSGPTDRRMRPTTVNFAHNLYLRDMMVANGDLHKPIWISEAAWNPIDSPEVRADVANRENFGVMTQEQAARYMPLAYQRAQEEWPWVGAVFYWFFKRPADYERGESWYYFRMVEPDFTPLPIYETMKSYITSQQPVLYSGVHQAEDWRVQTSGSVLKRPSSQAQFEEELEVSDAAFALYGTDVQLRWHCNFGIEYMLNDQVNLLTANDASQNLNSIDAPLSSVDLWQEETIHLSAQAGLHHIKLQTSEGNFCLDSITVIDRTFQNLYPLVAGVMITAGMFIYVVLSALWVRWRR